MLDQLRVSADDLQVLGTSASLSHLQQLELNIERLDSKTLRVFSDSPYLTRLQDLKIEADGLNVESWQGHFSNQRLRSLDILTQFGPIDVSEWVDHAGLQFLEKLVVFGEEITGFDQFAASAKMPRLEHLGVNTASRDPEFWQKKVAFFHQLRSISDIFNPQFASALHKLIPLGPLSDHWDE